MPPAVVAAREQIRACPSRGPQHDRALNAPDRGWLVAYHRWLLEECDAKATTEEIMAVVQTLLDETAVFLAAREAVGLGSADAIVLAEAEQGAAQDVDVHRARILKTPAAWNRAWQTSLNQIVALKRVCRFARGEAYRLMGHSGT